MRSRSLRQPLRRLSLTLSCAVLAALAVASPASAAANVSVQIFHGQQCQTDPVFGVTDCNSGTGVFVVNQLPTGVTSITDESHIDFTVTTPDGCSITGGGTFHAHTLLTPDDNFFEDHALSFQTVTLQGCGGQAVTCTFSEHYHFVNGVFQYDHFDASCEPV